MIDSVTKRDGRIVKFQRQKIFDAICKAFEATRHTPNPSVIGNCVDAVIEKAEEKFQGKIPGVEGIQDIVEAVLIANNFPDVAKAYILYRAERTRVREADSRLMHTLDDIIKKDAVDSDIKRENANINGDTAMGSMLKIGSETSKHYYDLHVLNPVHAKAHREGDIHIHDLDFLTQTTTCCQIELSSLFKDGFSTGHGVLREPNDIASYSALACIAIQANQNDQHGGQSIVDFDYGMAPGVKKTFVKNYRRNLARVLEIVGRHSDPEVWAKEILDAIEGNLGITPCLIGSAAFNQEMLMHHLKGIEKPEMLLKIVQKNAVNETRRATYQAMEALIHNLNTMNSRAGAQVPFSSINYGTDTSPEGRLVVEQLLLATEAGLGGGETPIFPVQIFKVKEGVNYNAGEPNYDLFRLAIRVSAKRLFPNFSFLDAPFNLQYYKPGRPETEAAYMGCRTRVLGNVHDPEREIAPRRGNLSFTSINLPRIAICADGDWDVFYSMLTERMNLVHDQLLERLEIISRKKVYNFPFLMAQGVWLDSENLAWDQEVREVLKHGSLSIGFIGLAECLKKMMGKHHGESLLAQQKGLEIIGFMRSMTDEMARESKLNFTLLATPAEGLSGRFIRIDKERFGVIEGVTDREYYTNSFHVPVYHPISAFDKIAIEGPYHNFTNAGHITYVEMDGDPTKNLEAFERVIRHMHDCGVGYGSINHPVDRDPVCGYSGIIGNTCPKCGREEGGEKFERIRRITGYLVGTLDRFNNSKRAEVRDRVKHV